MDQFLFDNPVLIKHVRSRLRSPQGMYLVLVVGIVCCCIMWAGFGGLKFDEGIPFLLFFMLQGVALHLAGTNQVATSIGQVSESGILDFHRISPLPPSATALGFMIGAPIREYLVALLVVPFALIAALLGKPGLMGFLTTGLVLLSTTLLFHTLAMTSGLIASRGKTRRTNFGIGAFVLFSMFSATSLQAGLPIPAMLTAGPAVYEAMGWIKVNRGAGALINLPKFFGLDLPLFLQTLCYQLPLIAFLAVPVVRRMQSAEVSLYSKRSAIGFLMAISILNMGGLVGQQQIQAQWVVPILLYLNGAFSLFLTMAVTPNQGAFLNHLRRSNKQGLTRSSLWADDSSNRAAVLVLCIITYCTVQFVETFANAGKVAGAAGVGNFDFLIPTITTLATIAHFGFAAQLFRIRLGKSGNATLLVLLFLVWILPLLVSALCSMTFGKDVAEFVLVISPLAGIAMKSIVSLGVSSGLAVLFFIGLLHEERRQWTVIRAAGRIEEMTVALES